VTLHFDRKPFVLLPSFRQLEMKKLLASLALGSLRSLTAVLSTKPIKIIIPFRRQHHDIMTRLIGPKMAERLASRSSWRTGGSEGMLGSIWSRNRARRLHARPGRVATWCVRTPAGTFRTPAEDSFHRGDDDQLLGIVANRLRRSSRSARWSLTPGRIRQADRGDERRGRFPHLAFEHLRTLGVSASRTFVQGLGGDRHRHHGGQVQAGIDGITGMSAHQVRALRCLAVPTRRASRSGPTRPPRPRMCRL